MTNKKNIKELLNFSIINIDKPSGPTSFTVSEYVCKQLGLNKTSHFGTLDPKVTGVLPVALGRACKLTGFFLGHDKEYVGIMHIHKDISMTGVQKVINDKFVGKIKQLPPIKSRVRREERVREVKRFEILEQDDKDFLFIAEVEGGTYIRKLIHDLGVELGVGAHMLELRRVRAGIFSEPCVSLYDFTSAVDAWKGGDSGLLRGMLISGEEAVKKIMPIVFVKESALKQLLTGKPVFKKDVVGDVPKLKNEEIFAVFCGDVFVEVAEKTSEKGIFGRAMFVKN